MAKKKKEAEVKEEQVKEPEQEETTAEAEDVDGEKESDNVGDLDDSHDENMTTTSIENSGLISDLVEKMSQCEHQSTQTLALALGRMGYLYDMDIDDLMEVVASGYELQDQIQQHLEEHHSEELEDADDASEDNDKGGNNSGGFGAN